MAFGQNASITRTIVCYPTTSGSTMLIEYRGSGFDVVAIDVDVIPAEVVTLLNLTLANIIGVTTSLYASTALTATIPSWPLLGSVVRYANINGIAHLIAPTQGLIGGDLVRVSAVLAG
jgi:hypothetical protein